MPYTFRFLTDAERDSIGKRATAPPGPPPITDALQRAWEVDLAAHQALLASARDEEAKTRHAQAVRALEAALTKAAGTA